MDKKIYAANYRLEQNHWWFIGSRAVILDQLRSRLGKKPRILDAGCGTGGTLEQLAEFSDAYGLDSEPVAIKFCRDRRLDHVELGVIEKLPYQDRFFDAVIATDVIEHIPDDVAGLKECYRVLKKGGLLLITVPAYQWLWTEHDVKHHHYRRYNRPRLRRALEAAGFTVEKLSHYNSLLFPAILPVRLLHKLTKPKTHDLALPGETLNHWLSWIFSQEKKWLRRRNFPFGLSVIALARK